MVRLFEKYDPDPDEESESTPEELLVRMGDSDEQAFAEFYHRFRGYGMKLILEKVSDFGQAEEVYNDAMLKLYSYSSSFEEQRSSALTLFGVIAKRTAIDRVRGKRFIQYSADPCVLLEGRQMWDSRKSPAAEAELASGIKSLEDSIEKLSPSTKKTISLLYETGMSYSQIARKLQLPLGSVKSSIRRGIASLRAMGVG